MNIHNSDKYLTPEIIRSCFVPGKITHVNKLRCGNGFTTAFFTMPYNGIKILILSNREAVLNKQEQHKDRPRSLFLHGTSDDYLQDSSDIDLVVCVYDSFIVWQHKFIEWANRGARLMIVIDEYHSLMIGACYRKNLRGSRERMGEFTALGAAVCTVTATPFKYTEINVTITNAYNPPKTIYLSESESNTIARAVDVYKAGGKVIIYTNDKTLALKFKDWSGKLSAYIGTGSALSLSLSENANIIHTPDGRLRIYSSRGFEGHDIYGEGWHVYIFENRGKVHTTFTMQQIIQASERTRDGAEYIEYCRIQRKAPRNMITTDQIRDFITRDDITEEKKLKKDNFAPFKKYITPIYGDDYKMQLRFDDAVYIVDDEIQLSDHNWLDFYKDYLLQRNITIMPVKNIQGYDCNPSRMRGNDAAKYMISNRDYIESNNLLTTYKVDPFKAGEDFKSFCRRFQTEYRRIRFRKETTASQLHRLEQVAKFLPANGDSTYFDAKIKAMATAYEKEIKAGIYTDAQMFNKITQFGKRVTPDALALLFYACNDWISIPKNMVAHRDYNALVTLRPSSLRILFEGFGFDITEVDVKNCYPRILYALFGGGVLPDDFYGPNKVNKLKINIALNDSVPDPTKKTPIRIQRAQHTKRLLNYGIAPCVVDAVIEFCYAGKDRGELFNMLAHHERLIIQQLRSEIRNMNLNIIGMPRRHDSVLIFHEIPVDLSWLVDFKYLGLGGFFV